MSRLGYGIVAYVNILYTFIIVFGIFSLMLIPTMRAYRSGNAYEGDVYSGHATGMISNMGYSSVECRNIPLSIGHLSLDCPYGTIG